MAFPTITANAHARHLGATSHAAAVPACTIGDLVLVFVATNNTDGGASTGVTDFTEIDQRSDGDGFVYVSAWKKLVDGTESWYNGGAGGNATITHSGGDANCTHHALTVTGSGNVELAGFSSSGTPSTIPDPPSLTPSFGAVDTLWIAYAGMFGDGDLVSDPSGFTAIATESGVSAVFDCSSAVAYRDDTVSSKNPGVFTFDESAAWVAYTLAMGNAAEAPPVEESPYVPPGPGAALVEIYTAEPGAARWDIARWDEAVWSTAGWQDVTPESVEVQLLWGSQRPELGILSKPEPSSWAIDFYDPERTLDPANAEGPYFGDLEPGLPVRISHGEKIIRQGIAESIGYGFSEGFGEKHRSLIRVTDLISVLANARVPDDVTLSDTLFARARDAISAAGCTVTVLPDPASGDPTLAPWVTGQDRSAWEWIADAAESVLWIPYVTNVNQVGFRQYLDPLDRARELASPNLVGLQSIVAHNGLYSIVRALQAPGDGGAVITREITPKPRYGARVYERTDVTPDAGNWAMAVLSDRGGAGLRWVPGEVYPLTAADVNYFAELEAIERVSIYYPEADPAIVESIIVVGGEIGIVGKKDSEAIWSFTFQAAQTAEAPLIDDATGTTFLVRDDDPTEFLYPD